MAILNILQNGDELLRKKCRPVEVINPRIIRLLDDMIETLDLVKGVGLAASQIGVLRRIAIIDTGEKILELINPVILEQSGVQVGIEGCLSIVGKYGIVSRPMKVKIRAMDRSGNEYEYEGVELTARALCHEIDHLDGVLYTDTAIEMHNTEELDND